MCKTPNSSKTWVRCRATGGGGCKRWNEVQQSLRVDWEADNVLFCLLCVNRAKPEKVVVDFRDRQRHILFTAEDDPHLLPDVRRLLCGFSRYAFPRNCRRGEAKGGCFGKAKGCCYHGNSTGTCNPSVHFAISAARSSLHVAARTKGDRVSVGECSCCNAWGLNTFQCLIAPYCTLTFAHIWCFIWS